MKLNQVSVRLAFNAVTLEFRVRITAKMWFLGIFGSRKDVRRLGAREAFHRSAGINIARRFKRWTLAMLDGEVSPEYLVRKAAVSILRAPPEHPSASYARLSLEAVPEMRRLRRQLFTLVKKQARRKAALLRTLPRKESAVF